jgi:hypothetical protein
MEAAILYDCDFSIAKIVFWTRRMCYFLTLRCQSLKPEFASWKYFKIRNDYSKNCTMSVMIFLVTADVVSA